MLPFKLLLAYIKISFIMFLTTTDASLVNFWSLKITTALYTWILGVKLARQLSSTDAALQYLGKTTQVKSSKGHKRAMAIWSMKGGELSTK